MFQAERQECMGSRSASQLGCWDTAGETEHRGNRLSSFHTAIRVPGWGMMTSAGKMEHSLRGRPQPVSLFMRNNTGWGQGSGSHVPVHPEAARNLEELGWKGLLWET